jgi:hypothetical protein
LDVSQLPPSGKTQPVFWSIMAERFRETAPMPKKFVTKRRSARNTLCLPDLDHSKTSVLQSLGSVASKRTYAYAINDFITWYCSGLETNLVTGG